MAKPSLPVSTLCAHLLSSLVSLPGSRTFHLHVLVSTPRKPGQSLFLYASPRPKCLVQDVLVLLSEQTTTHVEGDSSSVASSNPDPSANLIPRIFVSAIEASVYAFPASNSTILYISKVDGTGQGAYPSPTSTLLRAFLAFYASPRSSLYMSPTNTHHLWIHLFARSQRQYLFPNSADHPDKKPLGDIALCKWWKKTLSDVAKDVETKNDVVDANASPAVASETSTQSIRLYYILPGQTEVEASYLLREAQSSPTLQHNQWIYSHPYDIYTEMGIPFPSGNYPNPPSEAQEYPPLASLIPHFEDDPKSRFLDELAATSEEQAVAVPVPTPRRKRQKVGEGDEDKNSTLGNQPTHNGADTKGGSATGEEGEVHDSVQEGGSHFAHWPPPPAIMYNPPSSSPAPAGTHSPPSRPSTPEPIQPQHSTLLSPHTPQLPTFPASLLSPHTPPNRHGSSGTPLTLQTPTPHGLLRTPQTPRTPRRPKSDLDTVSSAEFWERMSYRQECALGAVTGFFVAVFSQRWGNEATRGHADDSLLSSNSSSQNPNISATTETPCTLLSTGTVPHSVLKRVMSSLLTGVEFSTAERAQKGTNVMESAIKGLCEGLGQGNRESHVETPGVEETEAMIDEPLVLSPDIYASHVYASLSISNPPLARKSANSAGIAAAGMTAPVNVLGVRRKKKREG